MIRTIIKLLKPKNTDDEYYETDMIDRICGENPIATVFLRPLVTILLCALVFSITFGLFGLRNYEVDHYKFVCNSEVCEVTNFYRNNKTASVKNIDIAKIKNFSIHYEKVPRMRDFSAYTIYAECKDGTSFQLAQVYTSNKRTLYKEYVEPLNNELLKKPINIVFEFP